MLPQTVVPSGQDVGVFLLGDGAKLSPAAHTCPRKGWQRAGHACERGGSRVSPLNDEAIRMRMIPRGIGLE